MYFSTINTNLLQLLTTQCFNLCDVDHHQSMDISFLYQVHVLYTTSVSQNHNIIQIFLITHSYKNHDTTIGINMFNYFRSYNDTNINIQYTTLCILDYHLYKMHPKIVLTNSCCLNKLFLFKENFSFLIMMELVTLRRKKIGLIFHSLKCPIIV